MALQLVLSLASNAYREKDGQKLALAFVVDPASNEFNLIRQELQKQNPTNLEDVVARHFDRAPIAELLTTAFATNLAYIRDFDSPIKDGRDEPATRTLRNYKSFTLVHSAGSALFRNAEAVWFEQSIRKLCHHLVKLANYVDDITSPEPDASKIADAANRLIKTIAQAVQPISQLRKTITNDVLARAGAIFGVANLLFKTYFKIKKVTLFPGVLAQVRSIVPLLDQVSRAFSVEYRYWVGRYDLDRRNPREARDFLQKAFDDCTNRTKNKRLILIYLVAASIACGSFPSSKLLAAGNLTNQFEPLITHIKSCDGVRCHQHLESWMPWFHKRQLYFFLNEKVDVLLWRNICRRASLVKRVVRPDEDYRSFQLDDVLTGLQIAYNDDSYDIHDAENICMSLIEQGYIRGYILHSRRTVGLAGSGGFVRVVDTRTLAPPKGDS